MEIRPIAPDELRAFAALSAAPVSAQPTDAYLEQLVQHGVLRPELCFVAVEQQRVVGRLAYWLNANSGVPTDLFLLDAPWEQPDQTVAAALLHETLPLVRALGAATIGYVLDTPAQAPQWQESAAERHRFLLAHGFRVSRETHRFASDCSVAPANAPERLAFKTFAEVGEAAFVEAIERVSADTRDQTIQGQRAALGAAGAAQEMLRILRQLRFAPTWWQLGYSADGRLAGLVMPAANITTGTIGYIGVVPNQRGAGYGHELLARGTATLCAAGITAIAADADVVNVPMARAFAACGYTQIGTRQTYRSSR